MDDGGANSAIIQTATHPAISGAGSHVNAVSSPSTNLGRISNNPFFTAGVGLAILGTVLATAQKGLRHGAALVKRRLLVDVEISVKDESYSWFLQWMTAHQQNRIEVLASQTNARNRKNIVGKKASAITNSQCEETKNRQSSGNCLKSHEATGPKRYSPQLWTRLMDRLTPGLHHLSIQTDREEHANGSMQTRFSLVPGPGRHLIRYRNSFVLINRVRETKAMDLAHGRPWESITLTALYSDRNLFEQLFSEAHALAQESFEGKTIIFTSRGSSWEPFGNPRRKRPLESVVLDRGVKEGILADVQDFMKSSGWYYDRGIPYRRGYLFYGPPGGGKSSFIQALAGSLNYNIAILNLSERGLTDDRLNYLLTIIPRRTLVLLEDVDAAFGNRRTQTNADGYQGANVTFSGLLNALDGVASAEERILFLTTNHVDRLDEALVRPGRVDMTVCFDHVSQFQAGALWARFYGDKDPDKEYEKQFIDKLRDLGCFKKNKHIMQNRDIPRDQSDDIDLKQPVDSGVSDCLKSGTGQDDQDDRHCTISAAALQGLFLYNKENMQRAIQQAHMAVRVH